MKKVLAVVFVVLSVGLLTLAVAKQAKAEPNDCYSYRNHIHYWYPLFGPPIELNHYHCVTRDGRDLGPW